MAKRRKLLNVDEELDNQICEIVAIWQQHGFNGVRKPDVLRLLIRKYKEETLPPRRKPKSREWFL
jgi:hypothetical protein